MSWGLSEVYVLTDARMYVLTRVLAKQVILYTHIMLLNYIKDTTHKHKCVDTCMLASLRQHY